MPGKHRMVPRACETCDKSFMAPAYAVRVGNGRFCSSGCRRWTHRSIAERFWSKVKFTKCCWLWAGSTTSNGYGNLFWHWVSGTNIAKPMHAHRVAWLLTRGEISNGLWVLHTCDVRLCVRPDHLFLGTRSDNMIDCADKGRLNSQHGTNRRQATTPEGLEQPRSCPPTPRCGCAEQRRDDIPNPAEHPTHQDAESRHLAQAT